MYKVHFKYLIVKHLTSFRCCGFDYNCYCFILIWTLAVNDLGGSRSGEGRSSSAADQVVNEIKSSGGKAVADYSSFLTNAIFHLNNIWFVY